MAEEAVNDAWPSDAGPDLNAAEIEEYLHLWEQVSVVTLELGVMDIVRWAWEPNVVYSAYACRFAGLQADPTAMVVWESDMSILHYVFLLFL